QHAARRRVLYQHAPPTARPADAPRVPTRGIDGVPHPAARAARARRSAVHAPSRTSRDPERRGLRPVPPGRGGGARVPAAPRAGATRGSRCVRPPPGGLARRRRAPRGPRRRGAAPRARALLRGADGLRLRGATRSALAYFVAFHLPSVVAGRFSSSIGSTSGGVCPPPGPKPVLPGRLTGSVIGASATLLS